jgi:release factor glutamine methyltransferase
MKDAIEYLQQGNVPEPEESVFQLLAWALQLNWEDGHRKLRNMHYYSTSNEKSQSSYNFDRNSMTSQELEIFQSFLQRRYSMEPIQYIVGQWDFLDHTFWIDPPLLCPRPETEELVLLAEQDVRSQLYHTKAIKESTTIDPKQQMQQPPLFSILDIGCGTGVIGISLCSRLSNHVKVDAIDIDPIAISVSQRNAERILGIDWNRKYQVRLQNIQDTPLQNPNQPANNNDSLSASDTSSFKYDMVVSNPPYIPQLDMSTLTMDVIQFESHTALFGGVDGLDVIQSILEQLPTICRSGAICWMEVDPSHPSRIKEIIQQKSKNSKIQYVSCHKDMFGKLRFVKIIVL